MDIIIITGILIVISFFYVYSKRTHNYWPDRGIPQLKNIIPLIGNFWPIITSKESQADFYKNIYDKNKDKPVIGIYELVNPTLIVNDPALIEKILIKDFGNFMDHGIPLNKNSKVDEGLFSLDGPIWRIMRIKLIPAFTSGKLKNMFDQMKECGRSLIEYTDNNLKNTDEVNAKEIIMTYTMDIIATTAFGLDVSSMKSPDSKFRQMGAKIFEMSTFRYFVFILFTNFPKLADKLGISFTPKDIEEYFAGIIEDTFRHRRENNIKRNDFVQMLLALKDKGVIETNKKDKDTEDSYLDITESIQEQNQETFEMTDSLIISQAYSFLTAGFEAMSGAILFVLFELARNKEIQDKARQEMKSMMMKHGGLTYQALKEMTYLNNCLNESFRLYPLAPFLMRLSNKNYVLDDKFKIDAKTKIIIPTYGLHKDPQYFPDPEKFDPDRFTTTMTPCTYLPFGDGPRMCIGMRFAMLEIKLVAAIYLNEFDLSLSSKTTLPLQFKVKSFFIESKYPIILKLNKRSDKMQI